MLLLSECCNAAPLGETDDELVISQPSVVVTMGRCCGCHRMTTFVPVEEE